MSIQRGSSVAGWLYRNMAHHRLGDAGRAISNALRFHTGMLVGWMMLVLASTGMSQVTDLAWDNGETETGSSAVAQPSPAAGDYVYRISIRATDVWRTRLNVSAGEADLYIKKGSIPVPGDGSRTSELIGSDGLVLASPDFAPGDNWYLLVRAKGANNAWSLATGEAHVRDLGGLPFVDANGDGIYNIGESTSDGGPGAGVMPPEGVIFYRTSLPPNVPAWALWMNGGSQMIGVRKSKLPILFAGSPVADRRQTGNLLLVPPYLGQGADSYFLSVAGAPGSVVHLDSRIQSVEDIPFDGTVAPFSVTGSPYRVFRVDVPVGQSVWKLSLARLNGDPSLAVKKESVAAETENDAVNESPGAVDDNVSLVAPYLTNGTWFVTVYGDGPYETGLRSGVPSITDLSYRDDTDNDQPTQSGWHYYRVPDFASQVGTLGWQLSLTGAPSGTTLAIRRAQVPGSWQRRTGGSLGLNLVNYTDAASTNGLLQRVDHEADIWYVGVYHPTAPLGNYRLVLNDISSQALPLNNATSVQTDQIDGEWKYFRVVIPDDPHLLGWHLDLSSVSGDAVPKIHVRRDRLPPTTTAVTPGLATWASGAGWSQDADFTGLTNDPGNVPVGGQRFLAVKGPNRPLVPGTYYVGVLTGAAQPAAGSLRKASYTLRSRGIGAGYAIPVQALDLANGVANSGPLAPRDFRLYSVTVPPGAALTDWRLRLDQSVGELFMQVRRDSLPDFFPTSYVGEAASVPATNVQGGKRVKRSGGETLTISPDHGASTITPGTYYVAVVSEGLSPTATNVGSGEASGLLRSETPAPATHLGTLQVASPLQVPINLPAGDLVIYRFTLPAGLKLLEAELTGRVGNPGLSMVRGSLLPVSYPGSISGDAAYGWYGGQTTGTHPVLVSQSDPLAGEYTVVVRGNVNGSQWAAGTATLTIRGIDTLPQLDVVGGTRSHQVTGQTAEAWRYFQLNVPDHGSLLGIRVSLKNVISGSPRMVIRKGAGMPKDFNTSSGLGSDSTSWPLDQQWAQTGDFTGLQRDSNNGIASGRHFLSAYNAPMGPGTYIIGVAKDASVNTVTQPNSPAMSYTVVVEGIGDGLDIPVTTIPYDGAGVPTVLDAMAEREIRFFRVAVPAGRSSWRLHLRTSEVDGLPAELPDASLAIRAGRIPASDAALDPTAKGGALVRFLGQDDHWTLLPKSPDQVIPAGTYFLAVTSLGRAPTGTATGVGPGAFELYSNAELPMTEFPTLSADLATSLPYELGPGQLAAYQLVVPERGPGLPAYGLALDLSRFVGAANYSMIKEETINPVFPVPPGSGNEGYSGGFVALAGTTDETNGRIFNEIPPGTYRVVVRSSRPANGSYGPSLGTLTARLLLSSEIPTLPFDGGNLTVASAGGTTDILQYRVVIPDDPGWLAWGVRLDGPVSGKPILIIRRGLTVAGSAGTQVNSDLFDWPTGNIWVQPDDFTKLKFDPEVPSNHPERDRSQQFFMASRERPLQPGTYYIGIDNRGTPAISPRSFTLRTFAVGPGYTVPVTELGAVGSRLPVQISTPRMPQVFKLTVPPATRAWSVGLEPTLGDMTLRVRYEAVPDPVNDTSATLYPMNRGGVHVQKSGNERVTLLPRPGSTFLEAGDYYFLAASDGQNPALSTTVLGIGEVAGSIVNHGPLAIESLGTVTAAGLSRAVSLDAAEVKLYAVEIPEGLSNVQFRLNNREGEPGIAVLRGANIPAPWITTADVYGLFGGETTGVSKDRAIVNFGNPPAGSYIVAVRAGGTASNYPAAAATLSVSVLQPQLLNFASEQNAGNGLSNVDSRSLSDKERVYYKVPVPATLAGQPVLGWLLTLDQGSPAVRIYASESDFGKTAPVTMVGRSALLVPPFLSFDKNWFIEVEGVGTTDYVLRSEPVRLTGAPWVLPTVFNALAGDSNPGQPDGQGIRRQLLQDGWEFFALDVPENNLGLLRLALEQYSGNPNVYVRQGAIPTIDHRSTGASGDYLFQYRMIEQTSENGNFSEISATTKEQSQLAPGRWYVGVKSEPLSSVRTQSEYRLKAHSGVVTDVDLSTSAALENLSLAAKDWRYFRFTVPRNGIPQEWRPFFSRVSGSSVAYLRDTLPPFSYVPQSITTVTFNDWSTDLRNKVPSGAYVRALNPGTLNLPVPPLRPGATYFLGLYGNTAGGSVNVSSSISPQALAIDHELFYRGQSTEISLPPLSSRLLRIVVPPEATRLKVLCAQNTTGLALKLEQGAPPSALSSVNAHKQNTIPYLASHTFNEALGTTWPFVAGKDYYLLLTNTNATTAIISTVSTSGSDPATEDEDGDGMLDLWEVAYFSNLTQLPGSDFDADGSTNLQEFLNGTDPKNASSVRYILTTAAPGGALTATPLAPHHAPGTSIALLATPVPGDIFREWRSSVGTLHRSTQAQASVAMNANVLATAVFETSLGRALDTPSATPWSVNPSGRRWYGQYVDHQDGTDAAVSPADLGPSQFATVSTRFTGPGTLTFWWKVSSLANHGVLAFRQNYETVSTITGTTGTWVQVTRELGEGPHVVDWQYYRTNNSATGGENTGYLDQVRFVSANPPANTFENWRSGAFSPAELANDAISGWSADPDQDGLPNLTEAALGSSPKSRATPAWALAITDNDLIGAQRRILLSTRAAEIPPENIRLEIQASPSLAAATWITLASRSGSGPWTAESTSVAGVTMGAATDGSHPVELEENMPILQAGQRFYRLNAVLTD
jgi:large repetitive protein